MGSLHFGSDHLLCLVETQLSSTFIHEEVANKDRGQQWIDTAYEIVWKIPGTDLHCTTAFRIVSWTEMSVWTEILQHTDQQVNQRCSWTKEPTHQLSKKAHVRLSDILRKRESMKFLWQHSVWYRQNWMLHAFPACFPTFKLSVTLLYADFR